jgi:hypothetical protein
MTNGELKIEKGIPMPRRRNAGIIPTLRTMEAGDSMVVPQPLSTANNSCAQAFGRGNFICRKVDDKHTRVWRTK